MKYFIFLFVVTLFSCTSRNNRNSNSSLLRTQKDSLIIMNAIFADMKKENFLNIPKYTINSFSCILTPRNENILEISTNSKGTILIDSIHNNNGIYNSVIDFYTKNRRNKNANYNYPFFSRISKKEIKKKLIEAKEELIEIQNIENVDIVLFKKSKVDEWNNELRAITVLKTDTLIEPTNTAYIILNQDTFDNSPLNNLVYEAYYQLRNELSLYYFNESYFKLFKRNTLKPNLVDKERLLALTYLQSINQIL